MQRAISQRILVALGAAALAACSGSDPDASHPAGGRSRFSGTPGLIKTQFGAFDPTEGSLPDLLAAQARRPQGTPTALYAMPFADGAASDRYLVQFNDPVGRLEQTIVADHGGVVHGYMPDNAFIVGASASQAEALRHAPGVRIVVPAPSLLKVDPRLVRPRGMSMTLDAPTTQQEAVVEVRDAAELEGLTTALTEAGGERLDDPVAPYGDGALSMHVRLGAEALLQLATRADVAGISPKFTRQLHNDRSVGLVQSGMVGRTRIWDAGLRGQGQIVAVADTGLHQDSCYFSRVGKIVAYQDWAGNHDGDADGHGTHVAGSVAGENSSTAASRRNTGMAPAAQLVIQDVAAGSELVGLARDLTPLLSAARNAGATIHSNSWGDDDNGYGPDARAIDRFVGQHRNFLVVVANGNAGTRGHSSVGSPATAKNIISVGALDGSAPERVASFSSRGPTLDGRIKPTLVAPGVNVVSAMHKSKCRVESRSGTSMATPLLSGAAALAQQYFTEGFYPTGRRNPKDSLTASSALIRAVLLAGADSMRGERDPEEALVQQGYGRLHLDRVLRLSDTLLKLMVVNEDYALHTGEQMTFTFSIVGGMTLDVALAWTGPPAAPGAAFSLVNDLDLSLQKDKVVVYGNAALSGLEGAYTGPDAVNVEEVIHLPMAPGGRYTVTVAAPLVPMGPQNFALVISGAIEGGVQTRLEGGR